MLKKIQILEEYIENSIDNNRLGLYFFLTGIFLLPTAFVISALFILIAIILSFYRKKENYLKDGWNKTIFSIGILIIVSAILNISNDLTILGIYNFKYSSSLLDLANWLPFFFFFLACDDYLKTSKLRKLSSFFFLAGSIPVLVTAFGQYFFNWNGPFEFLNGLIVWYQRPINEGEGITGLFNNSNYLGCWLSIILPFSISTINSKNEYKFKNICALLILIATTTALIMTKSRSAWGALILSIPLIIGSSSLIWFVPLLLVITLIISFTVIPNNYPDLQLFMQSLIPKEFWEEFSPKQFDVPTRELRITIWLFALKLIKLKPFFGYGAGLFPLIYVLYNKNSVGHTHNIFLELAFNYGLPVSIIFISFLSLLYYKSYTKINYEKKYKANKTRAIDKAWWTSSFILCGTQLVDVQYYDGKISIAFWILLAGLKSIINEKQ